MAGQEAFNPDSSGYDIETAKELMELYPLTIPKPNRSGRFDRETIGQDDAFQAWVWHGEENDWVKHGGTLDPRTGMYLKGMAKNAPKDSEAYKSMRLGIEEEESRGNKVIFKDGRYYSAPSLTEKPTSKSMDDIIQQSNLMEALAPAVSTRTQPSGKAISDISIPTSEKYGAPADIRLGKTVSKGIPMNMKKITDALNVALTSPEYSKSWTDETWIPQKKRAEKSMGELLGMTAGFNKTREGKIFIQDMLDKFSKMNTPGGLVGYRTEEGFPSYGYKSGDRTGGVFFEAKSPDSPDTIAVFGDKSSWSLAPFLNTSTGVPVPKSIAADTKRPSRTLFHEGIHATAEEGTPLEKMGLLPIHQSKFNRPEEDIIESYKDIPTEYGTAMDPWIAELLYNAMMDKESEGAKLLKGFIK